MTPRLSDAGLVTLATMQAIPGCTCEAKWLRPARKGERERPGAALSKPPRQVIEPVNETVKGQPDLERHRGR
ncbi:MAG: hypothetical protein ABSA93_27675, partial [Streptosporangiaceae bacterium]